MSTEPKPDSKIALYAGLAVQAAGIVWWASNLSSDVAKNSDFVEKWPSGKWGSGELPSDTRQDLHISELQKQVSKLTEDLYTLKGTAGE